MFQCQRDCYFGARESVISVPERLLFQCQRDDFVCLGGLLPTSALEQLIEASILPAGIDRIDAFRTALEPLDSDTRAVFECLMLHWTRVVQAVNRMDFSAVAICVCGV